jgi:hypothetical protein
MGLRAEVPRGKELDEVKVVFNQFEKEETLI